ncbi:hypothetical protein GS538_09110 [Rhodococcus hoagii]|nr:hypothetical protein [Prescottella equi]
MSDSIYPAEPPVDLRSARKITPLAEPDPVPIDEAPTEQFEAADVVDEYSDVDDTWHDEPAPEPHTAEPVVVTAEWFDRALPLPSGAESDPAMWGRRGWLNTVTAGALKLRPRPEEVLHRRAVAAVAQPLVGRSMIMVANPKGGQSKTVTALMLAETFAHLRRMGAPVVWDNNEADGTLGLRAASAVPNTSVWDLIDHAQLLTAPTASAADLTRFLRPQPSGAEVLAADDSAERMDQIGAAECETVYSVLRRWREMVIVDTGNNHRRDNWLWTAERADLLVVPIIYAADATVKVLKMVHALRQRGLHHLLDNAIVVCAPNALGDTPELREQIHSALAEAGLHTIIDVPFEPSMPMGGRVEYSRLSESTRRAWVQVCAVAATFLAATMSDRQDDLAANSTQELSSFESAEEQAPLVDELEAADDESSSAEEFPENRFSVVDRHLDDVVRAANSTTTTQHVWRFGA